MSKVAKSPKNFNSKRYLTISEASAVCEVKAGTLRQWEKHCDQLNPQWRRNRRYYTQQNIELIKQIRALVIDDGLSARAAGLKLDGYSDASYARDNFKSGKLDLGEAYTVPYLMRVCKISEKTARRYLSENRLPHAAATLLDLTKRGRILPESWNHCFINFRDNIEIYQVGEVRENDVLNIHWSRQIYAGHIRSLQVELDEAKKRIKDLDEALQTSRFLLGEAPAANDLAR